MSQISETSSYSEDDIPYVEEYERELEESEQELYYRHLMESEDNWR